ncbi:hypothetical protein AGOR_G00110370 [Albula goreensis]|uniref:Uncharacterized protein n=1 Tax=Albula goreensis TaxID=1534307 RepID=A0A8T3DK87_9TELE|nr:hypothetical protein AGOR_G00110370 [Albula goreensis]
MQLRCIRALPRTSVINEALNPMELLSRLVTLEKISFFQTLMDTGGGGVHSYLFADRTANTTTWRARRVTPVTR